MKRFPELDGFRGFLAVMVMLIHTNIMPIYWLNAGMDCFFTISALVITLGLLSARTRSRAQLLKGFFLRRTARIFPMYYAILLGVGGLLLVIALLPASMGMHRYSMRDLLPYFFYLQYTDLYALPVDETRIWDNWLRFLDNTWSLAVEEQFYLLWGLLFAFVTARRLRLAFALAFIALGVWARASGLVASPLLLYRIDAFGYGILFALLYQDIASAGDTSRLRRYTRICAPIFLAILPVFILVTDVPGHLQRWLAGAEPIIFWEWSPISALSSCGCAALVGVLAFGTGSRWLAPLRSPALRYLGSTSYAIYLIHYPVVDVLLNLNTPLLDYSFPVNVALTVALVLALAHFATRLFNAINDRLVASVGHSTVARLTPVALR